MFQQIIEENLAAYAKAAGIDLETFSAEEEKRLKGAMDSLVETLVGEQMISMLVAALKRRAPSMLRQRRRVLAGFEKRNLDRWRPAFDLLEMILVSAQESGEAFNSPVRRTKAEADRDYAFEALAQLQARGLLIAGEAMHLMRGGYPDGALSRWRTLHETAVTAVFIREHGNETAERYLHSFPFQSLKAMRQNNEYAERAGLDRFGEDEIRETEALTAALAARFGEEMYEDYGWAAKALSKAKPSMFDLEKAVGVEHLRPYFRWASQHTHAGFRPASRLLGLSESNEEVLLVGVSNSGMTDPMQLTALSLVMLTTTFLLHGEPTADRLVEARMLDALRSEVFETAWTAEQESLAEQAMPALTRLKSRLKRWWRWRFPPMRSEDTPVTAQDRTCA